MADAPGLRLVLRFAARELRGGLAGFRILIACLTLGVAAIAAVGSISAAVTAGLRADAQSLLGGDVEFTLPQRDLPQETVDWLRRHGTLSRIRIERGMARRPDDKARSLVEVKAVDAAWPLYGAVALRPALTPAEAFRTRDGIAGVAVDPLLLLRLGLAIGDRIRLGAGEFEIRAVVVREPDAAVSLFSLGPRVLTSLDSLGAAGLDQQGTLSSNAWRLRLPPGTDPTALVAAANAQFPEAGWQARDDTHAAPGVQSFVDRTALFLGLVGLTALLVGGVGVGNAAAVYLGGKTATIATLKCLGASARLIQAVYLVQIMALAAAGIVAGLSFGAAAPWLFQRFAADLLPVTLRLRIYPEPLALAAGFGVLTALGFSLWPLARTRFIPVAALFRDVTAPLAGRLRLRDRLTGCGVFALLAGLAVVTATDRWLALWFVLAIGVALAVFRGASLLIMAAARRMAPLRRPWLRLALANLCRPGAPTPSIVLSLGLGLTVLSAVALVQASLGAELHGRLTERAPSFFFIDIQPDQAAGFDELVDSIPGTGDLIRMPNLRARITAINGVPVAEAHVAAEHRWQVQSDRGLTYAGAMPVGTRLTRGDWWPADYAGPPLLSLDQDFAQGLGLGIGDTLTFTIAGHAVTGRVANLRQIDWRSLGINFFTMFSPGALEAAPQTDIATVRAASPAVEERLSQAVGDAFPNVSGIRVSEQLATLDKLLAGMAEAIELTAAFCIATGLLVLMGAVAAGQAERIRDAVILKVLGATRPMMARGLLMEFGLVGGVAALLAAGLGTLAAWLLVTRFMKGDWSFAWGRMAAIVVGGAAVTMLLALGATWRALGTSSAARLRQD